jgi:hypothetical protein
MLIRIVFWHNNNIVQDINKEILYSKEFEVPCVVCDKIVLWKHNVFEEFKFVKEQRVSSLMLKL